MHRMSERVSRIKRLTYVMYTYREWKERDKLTRILNYYVHMLIDRENMR